MAPLSSHSPFTAVLLSTMLSGCTLASTGTCVGCGGDADIDFPPGTDDSGVSADAGSPDVSPEPWPDTHAEQDAETSPDTSISEDAAPVEPTDASVSEDAEDAFLAPDAVDGSVAVAVTPRRCGWDGAQQRYACGPSVDDSAFPIDCPATLVEGEPCGSVTSVGCCDEQDDNWYCSLTGALVRSPCPEPASAASALWCGTTACLVDEDACCAEPSPFCQPSSATACAGPLMRCDSPDDCPSGYVCCGDLQSGEYGQVTCETACSGVLFCDPRGPDTCPDGRSCKPSSVLPPYYVCWFDD